MGRVRTPNPKSRFPNPRLRGRLCRMDRQVIFRRIRYPIEFARQTRVGDLLERAIRDYVSSHGSIYAAAITYYLLLSLFPLMVVTVAAIGLLARDPGFQKQVVDQIMTVLPTGAGVQDQVEDLVASVARPQSGVVGVVALVGAIWAASGVFGALRKSMNIAFNVTEGHSFIHGRLHDLLSVLGVVLMAMMSTALTVTLGWVRSYTARWLDGPLAGVGWQVFNLLLPLVFSFLFFLLIYRLIPSQRLRVRDVWVGALLAAVGFEALKLVFSFYLVNFATFTEVYGAIGSMIALLVFVFMTASITILGAEIASESAREQVGRDVGRGTHSDTLS
jgi:membrane protein